MRCSGQKFAKGKVEESVCTFEFAGESAACQPFLSGDKSSKKETKKNPKIERPEKNHRFRDQAELRKDFEGFNSFKTSNTSDLLITVENSKFSFSLQNCITSRDKD